jgi:hypothetical protein
MVLLRVDFHFHPYFGWGFYEIQLDFIPMVGEELTIEGGQYKVKDVQKEGNNLIVTIGEPIYKRETREQFLNVFTKWNKARI